MSFKEFRDFIKQNFGITFHKGYPQFCDLCGDQLDPQEKAETWFIYAIHKECLDQLKEEAKKYEDAERKVELANKEAERWKEKYEQLQRLREKTIAFVKKQALKAKK